MKSHTVKAYPRRGQMVKGYGYSKPISFNEYGWLNSGSFPAECIEDCSASGAVDEAVEYWKGKLQIVAAIESHRTRVISYLKEFGAWTKEELEESSDEQLAGRILWLACCDIKESGEWAGLVH